MREMCRVGGVPKRDISRCKNGFAQDFKPVLVLLPKKTLEPEGFRTRNLTISRQVLCHLHQPRTPIDGRLQEWYIFEVAGLKLDRGSYLDLYDSGIRV